MALMDKEDAKRTRYVIVAVAVILAVVLFALVKTGVIFTAR